jgi:hypothetical protein
MAEASEADFLLRLFLPVGASDVLAALPEAAGGAVVSLLADFFLRLDLVVPAVEEVSAAAAPEASAAAAFLLLLDFLVEVPVSPAAADLSVESALFLDFFFLLLVDEAVWSSVELPWACAIAGTTDSASNRHSAVAQVISLNCSLLMDSSSWWCLAPS